MSITHIIYVKDLPAALRLHDFGGLPARYEDTFEGMPYGAPAGTVASAIETVTSELGHTPESAGWSPWDCLTMEDPDAVKRAVRAVASRALDALGR